VWRAGSSARRATTIARTAITRIAVGTLASRPSRALAIFAVPLSAHDDLAAPNHFPVHALDHARRISRCNFHQRMALAKVDFADVITGNPAFARDRAHEITYLYTVASSNSHEEPRHSRGGTGPAARFSIGRPAASNGCGVLRGLSTLRALALEEMQRRGRNFSRIELLEQRLERDGLARGNTAAQYRTKLLTHKLLSIVSPPFRTGEVQRGEAAARQLSEPGQLAGSCKHHDLDRLGLRNSLKLRGSQRRLIKNHYVCCGLKIRVRDSEIRIVLTVAKGSERTSRFVDGALFPCDDQRRRGIQIVEQSPERTRTGARTNRHVTNDRQLVVLRQLRDFSVDYAHPPRAPGVALDEILESRRDFPRDDYAVSLADFAEQPFESGDYVGTFFENVICPGDNDSPDPIQFEERSTYECAELDG
jgi:hypothetical protein